MDSGSTPGPTGLFEQRISGDLEEMTEAIRAAHRYLDDSGVDPRAIYATELALEELITNTIHHGRAGERGCRIRIRLAVRHTGVHVELRDDAPAFNPLDHEPAPAFQNLMEAEAGGRGIQMARAMIDEVSYRHEDGANHFSFRVALAGT